MFRVGDIVIGDELGGNYFIYSIKNGIITLGLMHRKVRSSHQYNMEGKYLTGGIDDISRLGEDIELKLVCKKLNSVTKIIYKNKYRKYKNKLVMVHDV